MNTPVWQRDKETVIAVHPTAECIYRGDGTFQVTHNLSSAVTSETEAWRQAAVKVRGEV